MTPKKWKEALILAIDFGLHKRGFLSPTYDEILDSVEDDFRRRFGQDVVLASNSTFGIMAREIAWDLTSLIQEQQKVYYSSFISTATDSSLDRIGANLDLPRKVDEPSFARIKVTTDGEYLIEAGEQFETGDGIVFDLIKDITTAKDDSGDYVGYGIVQSVETGAENNVPANSITIMSNPDENVLTVTNPDKAAGGQDMETDEDYRTRLILENVAKPGPSAAGIKSALLNLSGVRDVNIIQNDKADVDKYGTPPYSVHVFVLGGTDTDIGQCLIDKTAAGITLVGTKTVQAKDAMGDLQTVHFDYAHDKPIYAKVKIRTTDEWDVDDGADEVKEEIAGYINDLKMGKNVTLTKIYPAIYNSVDGVGEANVTIGTDKDHLTDSDITIQPFEDATCSLDDIEVDIN